MWIAGLGAVLAVARLCEEYAGPLYRERATELVAGDVRWVKALANVMERLFFWLYTINEQPTVLKAIVISTVVSTYFVR